MSVEDELAITKSELNVMRTARDRWKAATMLWRTVCVDRRGTIETLRSMLREIREDNFGDSMITLVEQALATPIPDYPQTDGYLAEHDAFDRFMGLTYANYLCLPRSVMQTLPMELQAALVHALENIQDYLAPAYYPVDGEYIVLLKDGHGRFMVDPLRLYRHNDVTRADLLTMIGEQGD